MGAYCQGKMYLGHSENLHKARNRMKQAASKGDLVYIKLKPYRQMFVVQKVNQKLSAKLHGPYMVKERICQITYRL